MPRDDAPAVAALVRLVRIAQSDTGQGRRVANFLLAWWNAQACGGFDLTDLWAVDDAIADDMLAITRLIVGVDGPAASCAKVWLSTSEPEGPSS